MPKPVEEPFDQFQQYYRSPKDDKSATESFKLFLWNPAEGAIFGRTPSSWCKYLRAMEEST
ncbi:sodium/potassium-dependent ATPase beta-2 subunit [Culex quinquefasciatus]|uniref:Sodium/potassium-dependent ATPase beta-2 subunit n=1 Tax=Culex quinquefasciatus TaxID=7176 RepID=B0WIC6_CULQU|nr:sodium/potassium-dependent ATPase beta-2 subunit [Culex quinquefasciatus]|eukprot:XP_001848460.1 sodium/potassium-dependent ATPase beta-2 subunit [Culex quinquefasciatus]